MLTSNARVKKASPRNSSIALQSFLPCTSKPRQDFKISLLEMPPTATGNFPVTQSVDAKALAILVNQRQTGVGGEVVGEFLIIKSAM